MQSALIMQSIEEFEQPVLVFDLAETLPGDPGPGAECGCCGVSERDPAAA
jgi:hypothetical protein